MICRYCTGDMQIDYLEQRFDGNSDTLYICPNCNATCLEKIRFGQRFERDWHIDTEGAYLNQKVKYKVDYEKRGATNVRKGKI